MSNDKDSATADWYTLTASCMCEYLSISLEIPATSLPLPLRFCHCDTCRYSTGQLANTVLPVSDLEQRNVSISGTPSTYSAGPNMRHFCSRCGANVYETMEGKSTIEVIAAGASVSGQEIMKFSGHIFVDDTQDGGISPWLASGHAWKLGENGEEFTSLFGYEAVSRQSHEQNLLCSCRCGGVQFVITPPNASSANFSADFPELFAVPRGSSKNPRDEKYWLNADQSRYIATICPCTSCRRASGNELPSWAYVPRSNIWTLDGSLYPFDSEDHETLLETYVSSPGVRRNFCGRCGAKVFFQWDQKPELIDVCPGLLRSKTGARAEDWLAWCTTRVSHPEELKGRNKQLAELLQPGLKEWAANGRRELLP